MTDIANKFRLRGGFHFTDPRQFMPYCSAASALFVKGSAGASQASTTTNFFTEMARRGVQDTTDWTSDTYKTLVTVASGSGLVHAIVGPTAGGASTTTFRITVDGGTARTVTVTGLASGERAALLTMNYEQADFTTAAQLSDPKTEALDADKATFGALDSDGVYILPWRWANTYRMLEFQTSLLVEAKHSASITNSTATAYSAVMYRNYLAA